MPLLFKRIRQDLHKFRNIRYYQKLNLKLLSHSTLLSPGTRSVLHTGVIRGEADPKTGISLNYKVAMKFFEVEVSPDPAPGLLPTRVNGKLMYYRPPDVFRNPLAVKCKCPDFRFSFEKQDYDKRILIGNWRRYRRKSGSNRPPRNPENRVGYCKHVYALALALHKLDLLTEKVSP